MSPHTYGVADRERRSRLPDSESRRELDQPSILQTRRCADYWPDLNTNQPTNISKTQTKLKYLKRQPRWLEVENKTKLPIYKSTLKETYWLLTSKTNMKSKTVKNACSNSRIKKLFKPSLDSTYLIRISKHWIWGLHLQINLISTYRLEVRS